MAHKALYYVRLPAANSPRPHSCTPHTVVALLGSQPDAAAAVDVNVAAPFCTLTPAVDFLLVFCGENFHLLSLTSLLSLPLSLCCLCRSPLCHLRQICAVIRAATATTATTRRTTVNSKQMSVMLLKFIQ